MIDPRNKNNISVDDSSDEEIVDDSEDLDNLNSDYYIEDEANEAFGDVIADLIEDGYDVSNLFDPSWKD